MVKDIHDAAVLKEIRNRFDSLTPNSQRQWGKMDVAQMMAHCSAALESALGARVDKQGLMGKIFGKMAKKSIVSAQPFKQNLPTAPGFTIIDSREFEKERQRLQVLITRISNADPAGLAKIPHSFFGKMTSQEWDTLIYKHLDHHLRQFGA